MYPHSVSYSLMKIGEIEAWYEHHLKIFRFIASILNAGGSPWAFTGSVALLFWSRQFLQQGVLPLIPNDIDLITNNINISIALCHAIGINLCHQIWPTRSMILLFLPNQVHLKF